VRQRFVYGQLGVMVGGILALLLFDVFSLNAFAVVSFAGFVLLLEVTTPTNLSPRWRTRLRWVLAFGFLVMAYVAARRLWSLVPPGAL
jgi:hypothetical protein